MTKHYYIQTSDCSKSSPGTELFTILEKLLPIKFICNEQCEIAIQGAIVGDGSTDKDANVSVPRLSLPLQENSVNESQKLDIDVKFWDDMNVPFPFRGRKVSTKLRKIEAVLSLRNNETVLASCEQGVIWSVSEMNGIKRFRSALPLPLISKTQNFNDVFNGESFLEMLILLQFIREISSSTAYLTAPLRASFIIDDPNLHWSRYGYVDYNKTLARAQKGNYHMSFATIPLDTWYTHRPTADLFRRNSKWLSLLIHGNNHAKEELLLNYSYEQRKTLLGQSIKRIERLEQKANLRVSRVMVPPHGACSNEMLSELPNFGFEAACISVGSLRAHNPDKSWVKSLGFFPSEIINGCPVLPRWGLAGNVESTLLVSAYLGQPLILRGHHQDLKDGAAIFDEFAQFINSLGDVYWSSMADLCRLNYLWRLDGTICRVKPFSRNIMFKLPNQATELIIESPTEDYNYNWQIISKDKGLLKIIPGKSLQLSKEMGREITLKCEKKITNLYSTEAFKSTSAKLIVRRFITEARDRLML